MTVRRRSIHARELSLSLLLALPFVSFFSPLCSQMFSVFDFYPEKPTSQATGLIFHLGALNEPWHVSTFPVSISFYTPALQ